MATRGSFLRVKWVVHEADHLPQSGPKVNIMWVCISIHLYVPIMWYLITVTALPFPHMLVDKMADNLRIPAICVKSHVCSCIVCFNLEAVTEDEHSKHVFGKEVLNRSSVLKCDVFIIMCSN